MRAVLRQPEGDRAADTASRSCDKDHLSVDRHMSFLPTVVDPSAVARDASRIAPLSRRRDGHSDGRRKHH
jgi:hypothetical protein